MKRIFLKFARKKTEKKCDSCVYSSGGGADKRLVLLVDGGISDIPKHGYSTVWKE